MTDIWTNRDGSREIWTAATDDRRAVLHGSAVRSIAWARDDAGHWRMRGAFWSMDQARDASAPA